MIGRLFQVTMPPVVFDGADMIRVLNVEKKKPSEELEDLFVRCRVSKDNTFFDELSIEMDSFIDWIRGGILVDPEPHVAAKILLEGNKV